MAHGHADYGVGSPLVTVHTSTDVAELAARLGSPVTFDRRGNVLWMDGFEGGVEKWELSSFPAGGSLEWSAESSKTGHFCAKLTTPALIGGVALMTCHLAYSPTTRLGIEVAFAVPSEEAVYQDLILTVFGPALTHYARLGYSMPTRTLIYVDQDVVEQALEPAVRLGTGAKFFHVMKVAIDIEKHEYVRAVLDNHEWDLTGKGMPTQLYEGWDEFRGEFRIVAATVDQPHVNVDNFIATTNEP